MGPLVMFEYYRSCRSFTTSGLTSQLLVGGIGNGISTDPAHIQLASISAPAAQEEGSEVTQLVSDSDDDFFPPDADVIGVKVDEAGAHSITIAVLIVFLQHPMCVSCCSA